MESQVRSGTLFMGRGKSVRDEARCDTKQKKRRDQSYAQNVLAKEKVTTAWDAIENICYEENHFLSTRLKIVEVIFDLTKESVYGKNAE
jgi:hypothetical protein